MDLHHTRSIDLEACFLEFASPFRFWLVLATSILFTIWKTEMEQHLGSSHFLKVTAGHGTAAHVECYFSAGASC